MFLLDNCIDFLFDKKTFFLLSTGFVSFTRKFALDKMIYSSLGFYLILSFFFLLRETKKRKKHNFCFCGKSHFQCYIRAWMKKSLLSCNLKFNNKSKVDSQEKLSEWDYAFDTCILKTIAKTLIRSLILWELGNLWDEMYASGCNFTLKNL